MPSTMFYKPKSGGEYIPFENIQRMVEAGQRYGLSDPYILLGLAQAEHGVAGVELGYNVAGIRKAKNKTKHPDYGLDAQIDRAAYQFMLTEQRYMKEFGRKPVGGNGKYTDDFIKYFSWGGKAFGHEETLYHGYAPINAKDTDPKKLNDNHYTNLKKYYRATFEGQ